MSSAKFKGPSRLFGAAGLLLLAVQTSSSAQQILSAPRVGGASSYDSAGSLSGNNGTALKRAAGSISAIPEDFSNLKLAPGFLLTMDVYDVPEFSTELRIDSSGDVNVPMAGLVHVAGETLSKAAELISHELQIKKILTDPQVNLNIGQYAGTSVSILGEVHNPGRVELLAPHSLDDVLALSGGQTQYAGNVIEIRHTGSESPTRQLVRYTGETKDVVLSQTMVLPGDTVNVQRAGIVYVLGSVFRPGGYVMQEDGELNVSQAISLAYGTTMQAAVSSIRLIRKQPDGSVQEIEVPYRAIMKGKTPPPKLQAEDVIYVPVSKVKTILTAGLANTAATAVIYTTR